VDGYEITIGEPVSAIVEMLVGLRPPHPVEFGQQYGKHLAPPWFTVRRPSDGAEIDYVIEDGLPRLAERRGWRGHGLPAKQLDEVVAAAAAEYTSWLATLYRATFKDGSTEVPAPSADDVQRALDNYREFHPRPGNQLGLSFYEQIGILCRNRQLGQSRVEAVVEGLPGAPSEKSARKYIRNAEGLGIDCAS
jgi:hypothetical protein